MVPSMNSSRAARRHPMLQWCLSMSSGRRTGEVNLYPTKQRPGQKTGAAAAQFMAIDRALPEKGDATGLEAFLANSIFG